jgi:hypothetical protein
MMHDKLVARINIVGDTSIEFALRAVVELHKPMEGNEHLCGACWFGDGMMSYPCQTIEAIEKELVNV